MKQQLTPALAAGVPVVAGDATRARAEALTAEIIADLGNLTETFCRIGERQNAIIDERLAAELGYARFGDYVDARLGVGIAQAL